MERLWAPWRLQYITQEKPPGCIFCDKPLAGDDRASYIVRRGTHAFVILNADTPQRKANFAKQTRFTRQQNPILYATP